MLIRPNLSASDNRRIQAMLMGNQGGDPARQLLDGAPFLSELLHTAIPQRAAAGTTAAFTRATTATFTDFEGVLRTAPAGCARFVGARFVRNLFSATENLNNAYWNKGAITVAADTSVIAGITCQKIEETAVISAHYVYNSAATFDGTTGVISAHVAKGERDICWLYLVSGTDAIAYFNLTTGTVGTVTGTASPVAEIEEVVGGYRISLKATITPGTINGGVGSTTTDGNFNVQGVLGYGIYVGGLQLEDITGRADQTTPSEYVSVGATDLVGAELVANGGFDSAASWTAGAGVTIGSGVVSFDGTNNATLSQAAVVTNGKPYVCTFTVTAGGGSIRPYLGSGTAGLFTVTAGNTYTFYGVAAGDGVLYLQSNGTGFVGSVDNLSVKENLYHGAGADGCQFFDTDLDGNPIPAATNLGYLAEGARTNLCLQSNAFTTTWVDAGGTSPDAVQNATGPNGQANYAWTLTDNSAVAYEAKAQTGITFTAGQSGCFSVLVEKKTSGPAYPGIQLNYNVASGIASGIIVNEVAGTIAAFPTGGSVTAPTAMGIETYNDGVKPYWLVWVSNTQAGATATATVFLYPSVSSDGTTLIAAAQGSTVFCDAQFESGTTFPSSRIPTTTAAVTRNADVLTYSGGDIPNLKTLMAGFRREVGVSSVGVHASLYSDATHYTETYLATATEARFIGQDGVVQWNTAASNAYVPGTTSMMAQTWSSNDIKMAKDGIAQTPDTTAAIPTITSLGVGHVADGFQLNGNVGPIYGWTRNQSQSELNAVTA